jgi:hypothetical protein
LKSQLSTILPAGEMTFLEMLSPSPRSINSDKLVTPPQPLRAQLSSIVEVKDDLDCQARYRECPFEAPLAVMTPRRLEEMALTKSFVGVRSEMLPRGMMDDVDVDLRDDAEGNREVEILFEEAEARLLLVELHQTYV